MHRARSADAQAGQGPPARRQGEMAAAACTRCRGLPGHTATGLAAGDPAPRSLAPRRLSTMPGRDAPPPSIIRALCLRCVFHAPAGRFPARLCRASSNSTSSRRRRSILPGAFLQSLAQFGHVDRVLFASLGIHTTTRQAFISSLLAAMFLIVSASFRMSSVSTSLRVRGALGRPLQARRRPCPAQAPPLPRRPTANDAKQLPRPTSSPACYDPHGLAVIVRVHWHCGGRESLRGMCSGQWLQMRAGVASQARFWHG